MASFQTPLSNLSDNFSPYYHHQQPTVRESDVSFVVNPQPTPLIYTDQPRFAYPYRAAIDYNRKSYPGLEIAAIILSSFAILSGNFICGGIALFFALQPKCTRAGSHRFMYIISIVLASISIIQAVIGYSLYYHYKFTAYNLYETPETDRFMEDMLQNISSITYNK